MKDEGLLAPRNGSYKQQRDSYHNDLIDCKDTFRAIVRVCELMLDMNEAPQFAAMIIALCCEGVNAATASMED